MQIYKPWIDRTERIRVECYTNSLTCVCGVCVCGCETLILWRMISEYLSCSFCQTQPESHICFILFRSHLSPTYIYT
jgi:hypothetical protein